MFNMYLNLACFRNELRLRLDRARSVAQSEQGLRYPLTESMNTVEYTVKSRYNNSVAIKINLLLYRILNGLIVN